MLKKLVLSAFTAVFAFAGSAVAQDFSSRQMTLVVPFAAGGPQDGIGRIIAQRMSEILKHQVIVENVGGAGGMIGSLQVARAAPDGYTFLLASVGTHAQNQTLYKKPAYNSVTEFTPVALVAETPIVIITKKNLPAKNLQEFIAYAKANQSKMSYGSAGAGSATHLGCVVANSVMGTDIVHVPYKGTGPAMQDLLAGQIDFLCEILNTAKPQIDGGKVNAVAIMTKQRSPALPNVPTALEQGVKGMEAYTWSAVFLPKGAPANVVKTLNDAIVQSMNTPSVKEHLARLGAEVVTNDRATSAYLGQFLKDEIAKWAEPIKKSGISID